MVKLSFTLDADLIMLLAVRKLCALRGELVQQVLLVVLGHEPVGHALLVPVAKMPSSCKDQRVAAGRYHPRCLRRSKPSRSIPWRPGACRASRSSRPGPPASGCLTGGAPGPVWSSKDSSDASWAVRKSDPARTRLCNLFCWPLSLVWDEKLT